MSQLAMKRTPVYILGGVRSPIGSFGGSLSSLTATQLATQTTKGLFSRLSLDPEHVDETFLGNVITAGVGQAPARQVTINSGCSWSTPCTTVNKVCSSGLKSVMLAAGQVELGRRRCVLAGGFESMSQAPYYLPKGRTGYRYGHGQIQDSLIKDGLWDAFDDQHMGSCAEKCASDYLITREQQDQFAVSSYNRAIEATRQGLFADEIIPIDVGSGKRATTVAVDEELEKVNFEKIPLLRPAFDSNGTVTAANASSLNDGAASLIVCGEDFLKVHSGQPTARVIGYADTAKRSVDFTTAPTDAINQLLKDEGLSMSDIDYFEINEAFSVVALANMQLLGIDPAKVNVNGGSVALGHPIGGSGARILVTLLQVLKQRSGKLGIAAICNGGGGASAILVENLQ